MVNRFTALVAALTLGAIVQTAAWATDLDDYCFRYDFSTGAKVFRGSDAVSKDPLTNTAINSGDREDLTVIAAEGPDGENSAAHPTSRGWSAGDKGQNLTMYGFLNDNDWTFAMSVRPGATQNGVLFSLGRRSVKERKGISICASSDPTKLIIDENKSNGSNAKSRHAQITLDNSIDVSRGFHTVVVVYKKAASGNAGTYSFYVDGVYQKDHTSLNYVFGGGFQFCNTCSGLTTGEVATDTDLNVAFRDVRFYSSAFSSADAKEYAALYPADALRPSASIRAYGVNAIDTGYLAKPTTRIAADFQYVVAETGTRIFGAGNTGSSALGCSLYIQGNNEYAHIFNNGYDWHYSSFQSFKANTRRAYADMNRPTGKTAIWQDGKTTTDNMYGSATVNADIMLPLFAECTGSATQNFSKALIYSIDIQESGTPVHFFAPHYDAMLGACFKDVITGELKGESMASTKTALSYTDGFGSSADYKYEGGTLYAKVYVEPAAAAEGTVTVSSGGMPLMPEADGYYWVAHGTTLTLSATPESGYAFAKWAGEKRIIKSGSVMTATITVGVDKAAQFEARFTPIEIFHASDGGYAASGERSAETTENPNDVDLVVTENAHGFNGVETAGSYMVNGSHSFSATTATSGIYGGTAVGYRLERWNRDAKAWEFVSYGGGNTFAYTNCAANGRMRLTWFWKQTGQVRKYGVGDYIQYDRPAGLLAHFDGILNAGANAAHETSPEAWVDLTGHFNLATNGAPVFSGDAWVADRSSGFSASSDAVKNALAAKAFTLELMISHPSSQTTYEYWTYFGADSSHRQLVVDLRKDSANPLVQGVQYRESGWAKYRSPVAVGTTTKWNERQYLVVVCDSTGATAYCNGTNLVHHTDGGTVNPSQADISVGMCFDKTCPLYTGSEICAVRMTAGALTTWQIDYNNSVDQVRFNGNVTVVNGAVGETGVVGASSAADGVYDIASGTWTITAPEVVEDGHRYKPRLLVETYNASTGKWVATTAKPQWAQSYTVDKSVLGDSRIRLTWTWQKLNGFFIMIR